MRNEQAHEAALRLRLADIPVQVTSRYGMLEKICLPYVDGRDDAEPLLAVRASDADLDFERAMAPEFSNPYLESCAVHRALAEGFASHERIVFYSCMVEYAGRAYAFAAPSGTGKSTHAGLWIQYLGDAGAKVLNGDKPFLHVPQEGAVVAYGCPWTGKEGWGYNGSAPLAGICILRQAPACSIERLDPAGAVELIMRQCYVPRENPAGTLAVLGCVDRLLTRVPVWSMGCDISEDAVRTSFEALTGMEYAGCSCSK